ncbi:MAG: acyl-CoA synthetase [Candidatus Aldehydirespiratoraceae bacterium]|jgi:acyl-CoA synthetase
MPPDLAAKYRAEGWWNDETIGDIVAGAIEKLSDATFAVHSETRPWRGTFGEVDRAARAFAATLQARGLGPGDVVMSQLPNSVEAAIVFWGAAYLGAVMVPVVHFYGAKEVAYVIDDVQPAVIVTPAAFGQIDYVANYTGILTDEQLDRWFVVADDGQTVPAGAHPFEDLLTEAPIDAPLRVDPDSPAVIGFTSGTTSNPKGVIHTHRTLGFEGRQLGAMSGAPEMPAIVGAPVGHFMGMLNAFLIALLKDQPIHLVDVWNPAFVLRTMLDEGLSMGGGATFFVTSLLDHPDFTDEHLALMPTAGMGGSTVPSAVTERLTALGILVYRSYGSTEQPSITGCSINDAEAKRLHTDGCVLPGVEIRLDDEGQIFSRGPDLFLGYTDQTLTTELIDDEGWYRTGDVGELDADGYLSITDRISDVIIRGGENISAQEVEEQLLRLAGVAEAAVVAQPDERLGERAAAVLRLLPGTTVPTLDEVRAHLTDVGLAKQKWPESIYEVADFPRTPTGKIQKFRLRQQLRDGLLTPPSN